MKLIAQNIGLPISSIDQVTELQRMVSDITNGYLTDTMRSSKFPGRNLMPTRPLQASQTTQTTQATPTPLPNRTPAQLIQNHLAPSKPSRAPVVDTQEYRPTNGSPPVFIANDLPIGSHHVVYCSYVQDGPALFSVQLKKQQHVLDRIMNDLPNVPLKNLTTKPTIGMACIARSTKDKALYRAAIVNIQRTVCRVTFVDCGHSEDVPHGEIYEIPDKYLAHKTFSLQFSLSSCKQLDPIDDQVKRHFEKLVRNADLEMKVMPIDGTSYVQCCELYKNNHNVHDLLKQKQLQLQSIPAAVKLADDDIVIIRLVKTVKQFYVQRVVDIAPFNEMMDQLLTYCMQLRPLAKLPRVGDWCAAMLHDDNNEWYRAQVIDVNASEGRVEVEFVDFGFPVKCKLQQLREMSTKFMTLPRQVTECCLAEFETAEEVADTTNKQMEMIAEDRNNERRKFRVSIREHIRSAVQVVNLFDESETPTLNVSSSLCKLLMPRKHYSSKLPPKNQSASDCTASTIPNESSVLSANEPKWEGTVQSTPTNNGQNAKRSTNNKIQFNASNASSIQLSKSREADGSETRSTFTERIEEIDRHEKSANRSINEIPATVAGTKHVENGKDDRRNNNSNNGRNSNNWRSDDNAAADKNR